MLKESSKYENLAELLEIPTKGIDDPSLEEKRLSNFPHTIKVHCWTKTDADKFARCLQRPLSSANFRFIYRNILNGDKDDWKFHEERENPYRKRSNHKKRIETHLWKNTLEFENDGWIPYITFKITFETERSYIEFARKIRQRLSLNTSSISYPDSQPRKQKFHWISNWENPNPKYPVYIVSKGRADSRLTARCFERLGMPYYIVIEPQDYDEYACVIDPKKILVLPFSNHGDGPGRARNWCWDHSMSNGFKRHWVCDDNISNFTRLHKHRKLPVGDGGIFRIAEEFVDRFENVPLAGFQYDFFAVAKAPYSPFMLNTRIYSVLLIENSCPYRWRGRYNEDTILALDVLKAGYCTIQFNNFLQGKLNTQALGGGNTAEFYQNEGTLLKSLMLERAHPDVSKLVWKFGRYHHHVDYSGFRSNQLRFVEGYMPETNQKETSSFKMTRLKV